MRISFKNTDEYKEFKNELNKLYNKSKKTRISLTAKIKNMYKTNPDLKDDRIQQILKNSNTATQCIRKSLKLTDLSIKGVSKLFHYYQDYNIVRSENETFVNRFLKEYSENISKLYAKNTTIKQRKKSFLIIVKLYNLLNLEIPSRINEIGLKFVKAV